MFLLMLLYCIIGFFFKQKTAYEMRISDWSSDVCSSDLQQLAEIIEHIRVLPFQSAVRLMASFAIGLGGHGRPRTRGERGAARIRRSGAGRRLGANPVRLIVVAGERGPRASFPLPDKESRRPGGALSTAAPASRAQVQVEPRLASGQPAWFFSRSKVHPCARRRAGQRDIA